GSQDKAEEEVDPEDQIGSEEIAEETEDSESTEEETASEETTTEEESTTTDDSTTGGTVTSTPSDDPLVSERIVNTAWKPIGTSQTGEHTSVYSEGHVDWDEKLKAIAYTTG
ncbi:YrrS family protein, partial [Leptospira santarosai]|nr:YrrS family protein [Leptospira santarosai]